MVIFNQQKEDIDKMQALLPTENSSRGIQHECVDKLESMTCAIAEHKHTSRDDRVKMFNDTTLYSIDLKLNATNQFSPSLCRPPPSSLQQW